MLRDKWRIDSRIARGGVGTVFAATHRNGNRVAIKVLHPELCRDEDTLRRFLQEGYAANQVNHAGVVRILDDDVTEEGAAFLVMELLEGELLEQRRVRKGGTLPLSEVLDIADRLLDVLAAAHDKGIVHRDIKPDNLFVTSDGRLKVLDFGFAQIRSTMSREQTATGYLLGTPGFMSPEQSVGARAEVDARTDIWAVGATLFTLLSGHPVHEAESAAEMLVAAANLPARSLAQVTGGLSPKLVTIVDRALAFDKADRWPNVRSMQSALRSASGQPAARSDAMPGSNERPVYDEVDLVEVLDERSLVSWEASERTVIAGPGYEIPAAALPSGAGMDDERTLDRASPVEAMNEGRASAHERVGAPSATASLAPRAQGTWLGSSAPEGTMIMDSSPTVLAPPANRSGEYPPIGSAPPPMGPNETGPVTPAAFAPATPAAFAMDPRLSRPDDAYLAADARAAVQQAQPKSRAWVFVAVALLSMVIVVVTGLLVLAASD